MPQVGLKESSGGVRKKGIAAVSREEIPLEIGMGLKELSLEMWAKVAHSWHLDASISTQDFEGECPDGSSSGVVHARWKRSWLT